MSNIFPVTGNGTTDTKTVVGNRKKTVLISGNFGGATLDFKWKSKDGREGYFPNSQIKDDTKDQDGNPLRLLELYVVGYPIQIETSGATGTTNLAIEII